MSGSVEKVQVCVRVRPILKPSTDDQSQPWVTCVNNTTLHTLNHRKVGETLEYQFQRVFDAKSSQHTVYTHSVKPLLPHVFKGQNASVFAYGPTGAGKTHTILGTPTEPGVIPRCVKDVFELKKQNMQVENEEKKLLNIDIAFSYLEIYKEKVQDLLVSKQTNTDLPIREDSHRNIFVSGLTKQSISSVDEFNQFFGPASKNRSTAMTRLNERSSRSHCVLLLEVTTKHRTGTRVGKMYVIDLAGSEDNRRTGNQGIRLKESGSINSSLLALSQVVDALDKGLACVPYRGSKLTRLLQDSLGGNAHSCMMVNLAPEESYYYDTYQTLNFARKTKKIVNVVKTNETLDPVAPLKRSASLDDPVKPSTPPKKPRIDPAPFLSPLLRHQKEFKTELRTEVLNRLEQLEAKLLGQMKSSSSSSSLLPCLSSTNQEDLVTSTESTTSKEVIGLKGMLTKVKQHRSKHKVYSDGSTDSGAGLPDVSSSPLFVKVQPFKRSKGFKSTAAPDADADTQEVTTSSDKQQAHNEKILQLLNSGNVAHIKQLQTVGAKKAAMIAQWTNFNGNFQMFEDLRQAGFTAAGLQTFLKKNFVHLEDT